MSGDYSGTDIGGANGPRHPPNGADTGPLARVKAMLLRCVDAAVTDEEASTTAALAVKIARKHGIPIGPTATGSDGCASSSSVLDPYLRATIVDLSAKLEQVSRARDAWRDAHHEAVRDEARVRAERDNSIAAADRAQQRERAALDRIDSLQVDVARRDLLLVLSRRVASAPVPTSPRAVEPVRTSPIAAPVPTRPPVMFDDSLLERVRAALRTCPHLSTSALRKAVGGRALRVDAAVAELVRRGEVADTVTHRGRRTDHAYSLRVQVEQPVPTRPPASHVRAVRTCPDRRNAEAAS